MEIRCAGCGCVVDRGVRLAICGDPKCCCKELPVRGGDKHQGRAQGPRFTCTRAYVAAPPARAPVEVDLITKSLDVHPGRVNIVPI